MKAPKERQPERSNAVIYVDRAVFETKINPKQACLKHDALFKTCFVVVTRVITTLICSKTSTQLKRQNTAHYNVAYIYALEHHVTQLMDELEVSLLLELFWKVKRVN